MLEKRGLWRIFKQKLKPSWIEWLRSMLHYYFLYFLQAMPPLLLLSSWFYTLFLLCKCCFNDSEMEKELKRHIHGIFNEHLRMHHALRLYALSILFKSEKKSRERLAHDRVGFSDDSECICCWLFYLIKDFFLNMIQLSLICIKSRSFHSGKKTLVIVLFLHSFLTSL